MKLFNYNLFIIIYLIYVWSEGQMRTYVRFRKIKLSNAAKCFASKDCAMDGSVVKFA